MVRDPRGSLGAQDWHLPMLLSALQKLLQKITQPTNQSLHPGIARLFHYSSDTDHRNRRDKSESRKMASKRTQQIIEYAERTRGDPEKRVLKGESMF